ncbi:MAG: hypothetical protein AAGG11_10810 [Pseudomonadota bacterium]
MNTTTIGARLKAININAVGYQVMLSEGGLIQAAQAQASRHNAGLAIAGAT